MAQETQMTEEELMAQQAAADALEDDGADLGLSEEHVPYDGRYNPELLADFNGTRTELIEKYMNLSVSEREITPRFKSYIEGEVKGDGIGKDAESGRWDDCAEGKSVVLNEGLPMECKITNLGDGKYRCESDYLGTFEYDQDDWAIGYKEVPGSESENADGSLTKVPVFRYVGNMKSDMWHGESLLGVDRGEQVTIPDGVKVLDYTFEGNTHLQLVPGIPNSVISAHGAFAGCTNIHGASHEFKKGESWLSNSGGHWDLPDGFVDGSDMFRGCSSLGDTYIGKLPSGILTINGMFAGCSKLLEEGSGKYKEMDTEGCKYLEDEFSSASDAESSNRFKQNALREYEELKEEHEQIDWESESEESNEKHQDAVGANTAERTQKVLDGTDLVGTAEDLPLDIDLNPEGARIQRNIMTGVSGLGIGLLVSSVSDSKLAGLIAGVGGGLLLNKSGVLDHALDPIVCWVRDIMPEGTIKDMLTQFEEKIHTPTAEEIEASKARRVEQFATTGMQNAYERAMKSPGVEIDASMRVQGAALVSQDCYYAAAKQGENGDAFKNLREISSNCVHEMEVNVFEKHKDKLSSGELNEEMREYYTQLLQGMAAGSDGAYEMLDEACKDDAEKRGITEIGIKMANRSTVEPVMESLMKYDEQYHFMRESDWQMLDNLNIAGVGRLSQYSVQEFDSQSALDAAELEDHMLGISSIDAGEETEAGAVSEADQSGAEPKAEEKGSEKADDKIQTHSDYGAKAENAFGDVVKQDGAEYESETER